MPNDESRSPVHAAAERRASRIATGGIILGLACTAAGMLAHSPALGGAGLVVVLAAVLFRRTLARFFADRS